MTNLSQRIVKTLHITGDTNTAHHIEVSLKTDVSEDHYLAWQDALYEGPIDSEASLIQLSELRSHYFIDTGWVTREEIGPRYQQRNDELMTFRDYDEVVLWFGHDLNSQLQLVQLVHWFAQQDMGETVLSMVSAERMQGINAYLGLNLLGEDAIKMLDKNRWEVTLGQMTVCELAWRAFGAENPNVILRFYEMDNAVIPHLNDAILRYLKQFPAQGNGLSHTEFLMVNALKKQPEELDDLYLAVQSKEASPFMNQAIFGAYVRNMSDGAMPMIDIVTVPDEREGESESELVDVTVEQKALLSLSDVGRQVLHNWVDWVQINGINRTLGGTVLREGCVWRYDQLTRKLIQAYV